MLKKSLINPLNVFYVAHLLLMVDKSFVDLKFSPDADRLFENLNTCIREFHQPINNIGKELSPIDDIDKYTQDLISVVEKFYNSLTPEAKEEISEIIQKMEKFHRGKMKNRT